MCFDSSDKNITEFEWEKQDIPKVLGNVGLVEHQCILFYSLR